jgi:hypothetical protein
LKDVPKFDKSDIAERVFTLLWYLNSAEYLEIPGQNCKIGSRRAKITWEDEFR